MFVRICLLVLLALAMATGSASAAEVTDDQAELAELGIEDAVLVRVVEPEAPRALLAPLLVRGSDVEPPVLFPGRVFRPPRASMRVV